MSEDCPARDFLLSLIIGAPSSENTQYYILLEAKYMCVCIFINSCFIEQQASVCIPPCTFIFNQVVSISQQNGNRVFKQSITGVSAGRVEVEQKKILERQHLVVSYTSHNHHPGQFLTKKLAVKIISYK